MKICIISEGSYPYVTGGVSAWIQDLITCNPDFEFVIYCIGAEQKTKGQFKYSLPSNVSAIYENFLDEYKEIPTEWGKNYILRRDSFNALKSLICGEPVDWEKIFEYIHKGGYDNSLNFLMSADFLEIVKEAAEEKYPQVPFTEFFWTIRSMLLPMFFILERTIPEADIYHSVSTGYAGLVGSYAHYKYRKPFLLTEHGIYSREREEEIIKSDWVRSYFKDNWINFFYQLSNCSYSYANRVITLFNKNKEIEIELGCPPNKISIIPNGVDLNRFQNLIRTRNDSWINVGAIVRIVPIKDIKTMIHAFTLAKNKIPLMRLYIMGPDTEDPEYHNECVQLVNELESQDIIFTGKINIKEYLPNMDFMLLSSISEGQPFAILEAMAAKKATISTDVGCCRELLEGGYDEFDSCGIVVPIMDYEKMARNIVLLAENRELREKMGLEGYKRIETYYTIDKFKDRYSRLYKKLHSLRGG